MPWDVLVSNWPVWLTYKLYLIELLFFQTFVIVWEVGAYHCHMTARFSEKMSDVSALVNYLRRRKKRSLLLDSVHVDETGFTDIILKIIIYNVVISNIIHVNACLFARSVTFRECSSVGVWTRIKWNTHHGAFWNWVKYVIGMIQLEMRERRIVSSI